MPAFGRVGVSGCMSANVQRWIRLRNLWCPTGMLQRNSGKRGLLARSWRQSAANIFRDANSMSHDRVSASYRDGQAWQRWQPVLPAQDPPAALLNRTMGLDYLPNSICFTETGAAPCASATMVWAAGGAW